MGLTQHLIGKAKEHVRGIAQNTSFFSSIGSTFAPTDQNKISDYAHTLVSKEPPTISDLAHTLVSKEAPTPSLLDKIKMY